MRGRRLLAVPLAAALVLGGSASCTGDPPDGLYAPVEAPDAEPGDQGTAAGADLRALPASEDPEDMPGCAASVTWDDDPEVDQSLILPYGRSVVLSGERNGQPQTVVCDFDPDGHLLTSEPLSNTGTDQPVGNDYATRVGQAIGRVDIGIPDDATTAVVDLGRWTLGYDVSDLRLLRLHALEGGSPAEGFTIGTVTFTDADGADVTPESIPIPDVVHGVPRDRGSGVDD